MTPPTPLPDPIATPVCPPCVPPLDQAANPVQNAPPANPQLPPDPSPPETLQPFPSARQRNGTIARLPKATRQRINQLLDDGTPYAQVIRELGPDGQGLDPEHIRRWKAGGYQDHLRELRFQELCLQRQEHALQVLSQNQHVQGFQATQQLAAAQICEVLADLGPDILREALQANPLNYFRLLNAFSRLASGGLKCERHLLEEALRQAELQKESPNPKKGISPEAVKEMQDQLKLM